MKRSEQLAWTGLGALGLCAVILLAGGVIYKVTGWWAGFMLVAGQSVVVGLLAWGMMLARQVREMEAFDRKSEMRSSTGAAAAAGGFRMSLSDDVPTASRAGGDQDAGSRTLDVGFQRMVTGLTGLTLVGLTAGVAYWLWAICAWSNKYAGVTFPVAGTLEAARKGERLLVDELGLVIGLSAAGIYAVMWWLTRRPRDIDGEALAGNFTLGLPGMAAMGMASVLGYLQVAWASEMAAGVIGFFMLLQGLELIANSLRSYANVEELDQEAVDLQNRPLVPMLGSVWLGGLRMLFAEGLGMNVGQKKEKGVIGRMMPRALAAMAVVAILISCLRVVEPGTQAVLERFGSAPWDEQTHMLKPEALLKPGLHLTLPWPIDQLVVIPTERLQETSVGAELHAAKAGLDFQFWTFRPGGATDEPASEYLTGDTGGPQLLETFVSVQWRVRDPERFYSLLSHSEFYVRAADTTSAVSQAGTGDVTRTLPIYEAIMQDCASYAVTRTFAIHPLDEIMINNRRKVEEDCLEALQAKLDSLTTGDGKGPHGCGIEVVSLVIKDLHPPYGWADRQDPTATPLGPDMGQGNQWSRGPASAYEFVVNAREWYETLISDAQAQSIVTVNRAAGEAAQAIQEANGYKSNRIAEAQGQAGWMLAITGSLPADQRANQLRLMELRMMTNGFVSADDGTLHRLKDLLDPVAKVIVDPEVKDVTVYQKTENGGGRGVIP